MPPPPSSRDGRLARLPLNLLSLREQNSILPSHLKKLASAPGILAFILYVVAFTWSLNMN